MSVRRHYVISLINQGAQVGVLALIMIFVARGLGPEGKGAVALFLAIPTMLAGMTYLGLQPGTTYFASSGRAGLGVLAANALVFLAVVGGATTLLLWLARGMLADVLHLDFDHMMWVALAALVLPTYLAEFGACLLIGQRRFGHLAVANSVVGVTFLVAFAVLLFGEGATVGRACLLFVLYRLVRGIGLWAALPWREAGPFRVDLVALRGVLSFGLQGHVGTMLQMAVYRLDLLFVNALAGVAATGLYTAATFFSELVGHLAQALAVVILPEVAAREPDAARHLASRVARQTVWASAAVGLLLALAAPVVLPGLFGTAFADAVTAVWLLTPGIIALSLTRVLAPAIAGAGWPWAPSLGAAVGLVLTIALDIALIPRWSFYGAAVASSIAYGVQCAFMVWMYRRQTGAPLREILELRWGDFAGVMARLRAGARAAD